MVYYDCYCTIFVHCFIRRTKVSELLLELAVFTVVGQTEINTDYAKMLRIIVFDGNPMKFSQNKTKNYEKICKTSEKLHFVLCRLPTYPFTGTPVGAKIA